MTESWLPTLITPSPESGYDLAIKLSRTAIKLTQPDAEVRARVRPSYAEDGPALIHVAHVIAMNFQTVAAANNHWRD